jgi:hypothetical protein
MALLKAQKEIDPVRKGGTNKQYGGQYTYAKLEDIIDAIKGPLNDNGIYFSQQLHTEGGVDYLVTSFTHAESEQVISSKVAMRLDKLTCQGVGSATTYYKKYCLAAAMGLKTTDDDGQVAESEDRLAIVNDILSMLKSMCTKMTPEEKRNYWEKLTNQKEYDLSDWSFSEIIDLQGKLAKIIGGVE